MTVGIYEHPDPGADQRHPDRRRLRAHRHRPDDHLRRHARDQLRARRPADARHVHDVLPLRGRTRRSVPVDRHHHAADVPFRRVPAEDDHQPGAQRPAAEPDPPHHRTRPDHEQHDHAGVHLGLQNPLHEVLLEQHARRRHLDFESAADLLRHHRRHHRGALLVPAEDRHRPGHPRHRAGPRGRAADGDQRQADVDHRLRPRLVAGRDRRGADLADLLHLSAGRQRLHAQGLRHHRPRRDGERRRRHPRRRAHRRGRIGRRRLLRLRLERGRGLRPLPARAPLQAVGTSRKVAHVMARNVRIALITLALGGLIVLPLYVESTYVLHMMILIFINVIVGSSWNILGGYTGQYSVGHAAYFGVGAYTTMILMQFRHVAPWWGVWAGTGVAVVTALIIGYICFRLRGPYFVLASIAVAEIFRVTALNLKDITNGAEGILITEIPPLTFGETILTDWSGKVPFYYTGLIIAFVTILASF